MEMPMSPPASVTLPPKRDETTGVRLNATPAGSARALSNLKPKVGWPSPVADDGKQTYVLFDLLEYRKGSDESDIRWDIVGWHGTDEKRFWFKTEGRQNTTFKAGRSYDFQLLYGKLVKPFYDLQYGIRFEQQTARGRSAERVFAVIGFQGLTPYRFETEAALQEVERFGVGSGLNQAELGFRLRYEIRREFAPYVGVSYQQSFGKTASFVQQDGGDSGQLHLVAGVRMWF